MPTPLHSTNRAPGARPHGARRRTPPAEPRHLGPMVVDARRPPTALGTILGVWAHPDDEAYLSAGLMALARANGQRVVVATATPGELGTADPLRWAPDRLGPLRRREMAASLAALGVEEHRWFDWADGGLDRLGDDVGVARVSALIDEVCPDTVITFGLDGMTGHPDHRAIAAWTTMAWERNGRRPRLLYACVTPDFQRRWRSVNDGLGLWGHNGPPPAVEPGALAVSVDCDEALLDQKLVALRAHASQTIPLIALLGEDTYRRWWEQETFVDARAALDGSLPAAAGARPETHRENRGAIHGLK